MARPDVESEVVATVERFLEAAGRLDFDALATMFAPGASIGSATLRDGRWVTASHAADAWLAAERNRGYTMTYEEPVRHWTVHCDDGQLAFVRADARIVQDGEVRGHNIDYFTLLRDPHGAWRFVNGSYTAKPPGPDS